MFAVNRRLARAGMLLGIAVLALALAGCNSSSEDGTASPTASEPSLSTASATPSDASPALEPSATSTLTAESLASATPTAEATLAAETLSTAEPTETPGVCEPTTFGTASGGVVPVTISNECLAPLFYDFLPNGGDPFWHIHTQQDDTFISLELYTVYGPSWDGDTGTFPLDCNQPWGLCLLFDPDGIGPDPIVMWGSGSITIDRLDEGGYDVTFNGTMPPGLGGTVYDIQPTTWAG